MPEDVRQEGSKISKIIHRENFLVGKIIHSTVCSECSLHFLAYSHSYYDNLVLSFYNLVLSFHNLVMPFGNREMTCSE